MGVEMRAMDAWAPVQPDSWARTRMLAMYVLSLVGFGTFGVATFAALIWAYIERSSSQDPFVVSHCTNQIRTFWITLAVGVLSFFLLFVFIGFFTFIIMAIWHLYRIIKGLVYVSKGWAYDRPNVRMA